MPSIHEVVLGEHMASIAAQYGFGGWQGVWKHPDNALGGREGERCPQARSPVRGREPYAVPGAPLVPTNQSVFIQMMSPSSYRYRAVAEGPITKGRWQCFMHHGMAYACDIEPISGEAIFGMARAMVESFAVLHTEPFQTLTGLTSVAAFYWRLRFGGFTGTVLERIKILDLTLCRS